MVMATKSFYGDFYVHNFEGIWNILLPSGFKLTDYKDHFIPFDKLTRSLSYKYDEY